MASVWTQLPVAPPRAWNDWRSDREKASVGVALVGLSLSALSFYFLPQKFTRITAVVAIAIATLEGVRRCMTPPAKTQEQLALDLRQKAGVKIEKGMSYAQFFQEYQDLLTRKILQPSDIIPVLERDIAVLDYPAFIQKHVGNDAQLRAELLDLLPQPSKEALGAKCRLTLSDPEMTFARFKREYPDLISRDILKTSDIEPSLERDSQAMGYSPFMQKHAGADGDLRTELISILPQTAKNTLRDSLKRDLSSPQMTFARFTSEYQEPFSHNIIKASDMVPSLERDIQEMDYSAFMEKHIGRDAALKKKLIGILPPHVYQILRVKCLGLFLARPSHPQDEHDRAIIENKAKETNLNEEVLLAKDWDALIRKCHPLLGRITDPQAQVALERLFLAKAYRGESDHKNYLGHCFTQERQDSIRATLCLFELELFAEGKLLLGQMQWHEKWEDIAQALSKINAAKQSAVKEKLAQAYLTTLSHEEIIQDKWKTMREALGITGEMIENAQGSIRDEFDKMTSYYEEDGFYAKFGDKPLRTGALRQDQKEKVITELRAKALKEETISNLVKVDLDFFGLLDEVLLERWKGRPLEVIWKNDQAFFLSYYRRNGEAAAALKPRLLEETKELTVFQFFRNYHELYPLFFKPSDTRLSGKTFAEETEEAVAKLDAFDSGVVPFDGSYGLYSFNDYLSWLFKQGLINLQSPGLRKILENFAKTHAKGYLIYVEGSYFTTAREAWKKLSGVKQIVTAEVEGKVAQAYAEVQKALETLNTGKASLEQQKQPNYVVKERQEEKSAAEVSLRALESDEHRAREERWAVDHKKSTKQSEIAECERRLLTHQSTLKGLPEEQRMLQSQIESFKREAAPDVNPLADLIREIHTLSLRFEAQQVEYQQLIENDGQMKRMKEECSVCASALEKATTEAQPTRNRLDAILREIDSVSQAKRKREKELNPSANIFERVTYPTNERAAQLRKEIADDQKKLAELERQRVEAAQQHEPFEEKRVAVGRALQLKKQKIDQYVAELQSTQDLAEAKDHLEELKKKCKLELEGLESRTKRPQAEAHLRDQLQGMSAEMERCQAAIFEAEKKLPILREELEGIEQELKAIKQKEQEQKVAIAQMKLRIKELDRNLFRDPVRDAHNQSIDAQIKALEATYQEVLQRNIVVFSNALIPPLTHE